MLQRLSNDWWLVKFEARVRYIRTREDILMAIAWALPRSLVHWCAIRLMAHATTGKWSDQILPDLTAMEALKRWESKS